MNSPNIRCFSLIIRCMERFLIRLDLVCVLQGRKKYFNPAIEQASLHAE